MLQIAYIRQNKDKAIERLKIKNFNASELIESIIQKDEQKRKIKSDLDSVLSSQNNIAKEIGLLYKGGKKEAAEQKKEETKLLKQKEKELSDLFDNLEEEINSLIVQLPNTPHELVKPGKTSEDNEIVIEEKIESLGNEFRPHWEICERLKIIDFELGNKITGAGFPVYRNHGAKLQRALINFFLDEATNEGFEEQQVPLFVNEDSAYATGQLPDKEGQMYHIGVDNFYLIPTAEVPITNIFRDVIIEKDKLPIKYVGYTPCFRREAGSYGKDVRGLNRLHQFDKVEIVQIDTPENSYQRLEEMRNYVCKLLSKLGLHYRVLRLCGGDISFTSAMTYDMEVYSKGQDRWLEVSSVSNFETFQSNRLKLRYRDEERKTQLLHTLNGSALALPRIVASILENNNTKDGVIIPKCLTKYTGFEIIKY
ncbi:MAG: serine--tRNA ligase [Bacteroidetes bacterium GWE2_29_8]|nr:MAG: serine--tRNA ligase [Bacteroidetes bacterium GWE2_29_8]OFY18750.1 MAG: serine--tRNA ligase [Bacteroidetes bacterium GWF2_29_10]